MIVMFSYSTHAMVKTGVYKNDRDECEVELSIQDFFSTGKEQLVASFGETDVTPFGANLTTDYARLDSEANFTGEVRVNNAAGIGAKNSAILRFEKGVLINFILEKNNPKTNLPYEGIGGCYQLR